MLDAFDESSQPIDLVSQQRMRAIARGVIIYGLVSWVVALAAMPSIGGARWLWALGGAYLALLLYAIVGPKPTGRLPVPHDPRDEGHEAMTPFRGVQELQERTEELASWMDMAPALAPPTLSVLAPAPAVAREGRRFQAAQVITASPATERVPGSPVTAELTAGGGALSTKGSGVARTRPSGARRHKPTS